MREPEDKLKLFKQYDTDNYNHKDDTHLKRFDKMQTSTKFLKTTLRSFALLLLLLLSSLNDLKTVSCSVSEEMAPRITIQPNDLIVTEGESSEMNCDAEGWPTPTIEWYHNGQNITSKTQSRTTLGGSIMFLDVKPGSANGAWQSDTGIYYCVAKNELGQATSRNATLQVACKLNTFD